MKLALACANDPTADVEFYLEQQGSTIQVRGRKPNTNNPYYVVGFMPDGTLETYNYVSPLGFQVNEKGCIKISNA